MELQKVELEEITKKHESHNQLVNNIVKNSNNCSDEVTAASPYVEKWLTFGNPFLIFGLIFLICIYLHKQHKSIYNILDKAHPFIPLYGLCMFTTLIVIYYLNSIITFFNFNDALERLDKVILEELKLEFNEKEKQIEAVRLS